MHTSMSNREIRVSPDGNYVAIRSDATDPQAHNAWGVMHAVHGGHWSMTSEVETWEVLSS